MQYKLETTNNHVYVYTDYNQELIATFKIMGGKWISGKRAWKFKECMQQSIKNVMLDINDELSIEDIKTEIEILENRIKELNHKLKDGVIDDLRD
jgi:polyhydroxyalkanoate synthesis regulator phasin